MTDSLSARFAGGDFTPASLVAAYDHLTGGRPPKTLTVTPVKSDYCVAGGFEWGRFTFGSAQDPDSTPSRNGTYAIAWVMSNGVARLGTVLLDTARDTRRMQSGVRCETWKAQRLRGSPLLISVTPVFDHNSIQSSIYSDAQSKGWRNGYIDGRCSQWHGKSDYANPESAPDRSSSMHYDGYGVLLGGRLRISAQNEIEVEGSTRATSSCMVALNRSSGSVVTTFMTSRWYGAYAAHSFGDLRLGIGPTMRRIAIGSVYTVEPTNGNLFGLGALLGYSVPMGERLYVDVSGRFGINANYSVPPEVGYPMTLHPTDFMVGVSVGWSR